MRRKRLLAESLTLRGGLFQEVPGNISLTIGLSSHHSENNKKICHSPGIDYTINEAKSLVFGRSKLRYGWWRSQESKFIGKSSCPKPSFPNPKEVDLVGIATMNLTTSLATLTILRSSKSCVDSVTYDPLAQLSGIAPLWTTNCFLCRFQRQFLCPIKSELVPTLSVN